MEDKPRDATIHTVAFLWDLFYREHGVLSASILAVYLSLKPRR